ncbi:hypothetical protein BCR44DRAFT_33871 [Catenaria anguillulae PL171]|uniref:Uncharacterized protein n=1 Tax=Catenaria anguillulae PL171 TaxID=765915 RepID=A0A1Y2HN53_9FUNG|nr:hypothetical protein BCR44DRAFT_33871 [Catenaria anguillulae PL171]
MPNGRWFGRCRELWHVTPDYSVGVNEQRIFDSDLPLVVVSWAIGFYHSWSSVCKCRNASQT